MKHFKFKINIKLVTKIILISLSIFSLFILLKSVNDVYQNCEEQNKIISKSFEDSKNTSSADSIQKPEYVKGQISVCKITNGKYSPVFDFDFDTFNYSGIYNGEKIEYAYAKNNVIFKNNTYPNNKWEQIKGVHSASFTPLTYGFAKDKNFLYYQGKSLINSDPGTFKGGEEYFLTSDKNNCYRQNLENPIIPNCDGKSFEFLNLGFGYNAQYYKDKNHCYYRDTVIQNCDGSSFKSIGSLGSGGDYKPVLVDKNYVFFNEKKLEGVSSLDLKIINQVAFINNEKCFLSKSGTPELITLDCDVNTVEKVDNGYFKDKNYVYQSPNEIRKSIILENADPKTFKSLADINYDADGTHCYYFGNLMSIDCDPATLTKIPNQSRYYAKDKFRCFYLGKVTEVCPS
jgi:DKNYY family